MGTIAVDFESEKQVLKYLRFRKNILSAISTELRDLNKDLIDILYVIETKLTTSSKDTTSAKIPKILGAKTGESAVTSAACLASTILHELEKVTNPPSTGNVGDHYGDSDNETSVREHILSYCDRISLEAARWKNGLSAPIKPTPIFAADDPFVAAILNDLDSFLQVLCAKAPKGGAPAQLANWRTTADPGSDVNRIRAYTLEISTILQNFF